MQNYKILVPIDFSDTARYALEAAQKFAHLFDGRIIPFHVYVPMADTYNTDFFEMETMAAPLADTDEMEKIHRKHLQEMAREYVSGDLLDDPVVEVGNPAATITAASEDYDLIVMGSHGRSGFSRFFLGSVSDKVLRTSHVPVLTVHEEKQLEMVEKIMLPTDFSDHAAHVFPLAQEIALKTDAKIDLVHIFNFSHHNQGEPDEDAIARRRKQLEILIEEKLPKVAQSVEPKIIVSSSTTHEALLNENLTNPHDLIIMSTVGHTGIEYLMMGSTTANIVRHVKTPVLSVNPKQNPSFREK